MKPSKTSAQNAIASASAKPKNARGTRRQEDELRLLSRELHDEVGMLTALRMELRSLEELRTAPADQFRSHLEDANHLAEQSLRNLRDMAMGLRPSMLGDLGLGPSGRHGNSAKHAGIPANVQLDSAKTGQSVDS